MADEEFEGPPTLSEQMAGTGHTASTRGPNWDRVFPGPSRAEKRAKRQAEASKLGHSWVDKMLLSGEQRSESIEPRLSLLAGEDRQRILYGTDVSPGLTPREYQTLGERRPDLLQSVDPNMLIGASTLPPATFMELAEESSQQSLPGYEEAFGPMSYDRPYGAVAPIVPLGEEGKKPVNKTAKIISTIGQGAAGQKNIYDVELQKMLGMPMGPSPSDVQDTYEASYGLGSDVAIAGKNLETLQAEKVKLLGQEKQIRLGAQAETFKLNAITADEDEKKLSISKDLESLFKKNRADSQKNTEALNKWITSTRDRHENEDPISAFRMFDWFRKEKNEAGEWEDSFQWSGFATTLASLAAVAGNIGVNLATKGQVPIFMTSMLMKAMDSDLEAQIAQERKEGKYGDLLNTMVTALGNEHDGLIRYKELQFENAALYFKTLRNQVQTSDEARARGYAAWENLANQKMVEAQQELATSQRQRAIDMAKTEIDRVQLQGGAASRTTVQQMQKYNSLVAASAAARKMAENADGNWKMGIKEKQLVLGQGGFMNKIQLMRSHIQAFLKYTGGELPGGVETFLRTSGADALGRLRPQSMDQHTFDTFRDKFTELTQSIARSKDVGNLSRQEQEWWFKLGPNPGEQPLETVLLKLASLERAGRVDAINMWSIANKGTKQQYGQIYATGLGLKSELELPAFMDKHRESLSAGGPVFTGMTLENYPAELLHKIETSLGDRFPARIQLEPIEGTDLNFKSIIPGASRPIVPSQEITILEKFRPIEKKEEDLSIEGDYVYLRTAENNEVRLPADMGNAVAGLQTIISNELKGRVPILPTGDMSGTRTPEEFEELQHMYENYQDELNNREKRHPELGINRFPPEHGGGHAPDSTRKKGKHRAIDFQVGDSPEDPRYKALLTYGPLVGIFPGHGKEFGGSVHYHHWIYDPENATRAGGIASSGEKAFKKRITPSNQVKPLVLDPRRSDKYQRFQEIMGAQKGDAKMDAFLDKILRDADTQTEKPPGMLQIPLNTLPKPRAVPGGQGIKGLPMAARPQLSRKYRG